MSLVIKIKEEIKELQNKLATIQQECNHPLSSRKSINKGSTGHWDPMDNCYWIEHHCGLCDKRWSEDQ